MAESIRIKIEFRPELIKKLSIPDRVEAPKGSSIRWLLSIREPFYYPPNYRILFQLYFPDKSPFKWHTQSLQLTGFPFEPYSEVVINLATDIAEKPGEYKYGVKVIRLKNLQRINDDELDEELIEDDDPYLKIY